MLYSQIMKISFAVFRAGYFKSFTSKYSILYLMILPCIIFYIVFAYIPMTWLVLAFKEFRFNASLWEFEWIGLEYFRTFFRHYRFAELIRNTFFIGLLKVIVAFPFPIVFALMLNEIRHTRFKKSVQTISYLPHFISWVVVTTILQRLLAPDTGAFNAVGRFFGMSGDVYFLGEERYFYIIMFISYLWKTTGWSSIIYLAAISNIDPQLYDAAKIDGANHWQEIWRITLPSIKGTAGILFILGLGGILTTGFEQIYLLRTPATKGVADILDTYVIQQGLQEGRFGYATAVGLIQGLVGLILVLISNKLARKYMDVSIW